MNIIKQSLLVVLASTVALVQAETLFLKGKFVVDGKESQFVSSFEEGDNFCKKFAVNLEDGGEVLFEFAKTESDPSYMLSIVEFDKIENEPGAVIFEGDIDLAKGESKSIQILGVEGDDVEKEFIHLVVSLDDAVQEEDLELLISSENA